MTNIKMSKMENDYLNNERYEMAQKKLKEIKGFYWHLFWYLAVNIFLTFGSALGTFFRFGEVQFGNLNFGMFSLWFFWGIGLVCHWIRVFGNNIFFSKEWEDRKIKEFMEKDSFQN